MLPVRATSLSAVSRLAQEMTESKTVSGCVSNQTNNHATLSVRAPPAPDSAPLAGYHFRKSLSDESVTDTVSSPASAIELCRSSASRKTCVPALFQLHARYQAVSPLCNRNRNDSATYSSVRFGGRSECPASNIKHRGPRVIESVLPGEERRPQVEVLIERIRAEDVCERHPVSPQRRQLRWVVDDIRLRKIDARSSRERQPRSAETASVPRR